MPGEFRTSNIEDGGIAWTDSQEKSGIFARNNATVEAPAGTPAGNGVFGLSTVPNASGVFGANNNGGTGVSGLSGRGDGVHGATESNSKCGVFGVNHSTAPATPPSGSGVFGLTVALGGAGVFGSNNNGSTGRGVQGNGPEAGVGGFSDSGAGVVGQSNRGDGIQGFTVSSSKNAIFGRNSATDHARAQTAPSGNGVFGYTDVPNGSGVCGAVSGGNAEGAGVTGIGPTAGRFFGNVEISGELRIGGVALTPAQVRGILTAAVEVSALRAELNALRSDILSVRGEIASLWSEISRR